LESQPGFIGYKTRRRVSGMKVWTMTVWTSEEALNKFVRSDFHQAAMRNGLAAVKYGEFARTTIPPSEAPLSWKNANKLLKESPRKISY
jgi:heme-degrading monooxygenase HmoA